MWTKENRGRYDRSRLRYPSDLTDEEWALVAPLITPAKRGGNKRTVDVREVVNGLMYVLSTGCQWRAIPKDLPPRSTVHDYLDLWAWDGTLDRIHHALYVQCRELANRVLDELLDARTLYAAPDWKEFAAGLRTQLSRHEGDAERLMDVLREAHHAQVFRLLAQDLAGQLTVEVLADHLSALADLMLAITLELCWAQLRNRHRDAPRFAIAAYGKLGGKELGYASDLDIIFLYDDADARAPELYSRLAQRINTWLTSATPAGVLFETDLRLRPNGASGLMVSSVDAFREYQEKDAWVWEHQALTRARCSAGDASVGAAFEAERVAILRRSRESGALRREVVSMRQQMADAHPNRGDLFDLKHDRGGMVDIEFIVQYLVLAHAEHYPQLTGNLGNIALLKMAGELGLIPLATAMTVRDGYREYRKVQHAERLNGAQYARVEHAPLQRYIEATLKLWNIVFARSATNPDAQG